MEDITIRKYPSRQTDQPTVPPHPLTGRQLAVLVYLRRHIDLHFCCPSVRRTCEFFGFSLTAARGHFQALARKGMLSRIFARGGTCVAYELTAAGRVATNGPILESLPLPIVRQSLRPARRIPCVAIL